MNNSRLSIDLYCVIIVDYVLTYIVSLIIVDYWLTHTLYKSTYNQRYSC